VHEFISNVAIMNQSYGHVVINVNVSGPNEHWTARNMEWTWSTIPMQRTLQFTAQQK